MPRIEGGKYVVVGGASLLGSHIGEQLLAGGARQVVLVDNFSLGSADIVQFLLDDKRCTLVRGDMTRLNELFDPFEGAAGVFCVAGFLTLPFAANPWMGLDVNVRGVQNVLEACRYRGVKKVIFSSSVGVYGLLGDEPNDDDAPYRWQDLQPNSILYGATKIVGEGIGRLYQQRYGIDFVGLRYASLYGERQHLRGINALHIVEAYDRIKAGKPAVLPGDGTEVHDYVYVGDAARANLMAMESAVTADGMNIVTGVDTTLNEIVRIVSEICGSTLKPEYRDEPGKISFTATPKLSYSREKAKRLIGWEPMVGVAEGINRLIAWTERMRAASRKDG